MQGLGREDEFCRGFTHLGDTPGRTFYAGGVEGLNGVDEQQVRPVFFHRPDDAFGRSFRQDEQFRSQHAQAVSPQAHLFRAFLSTT